ncbi:hybrid sensor histidine kinase/response regulator [Mesoterricola silvestris]|nr:GAF domain-containing protein [Mesoterricola silvestris]
MEARLRLLEFAGTHTMDAFLTAALDEMEALSGSTIGFYHFLEPDQRTLTLQNWSTHTLKDMCRAEGKGSHYSIDQAGVWCDCVRERRPVIHNDFAALPHRKGLPENHAPVLREMVVPVFRGNLITAIIGVGNKPTDYDEHDVQILSRLGDLSWDIVERKRTEEQLQVSENRLRLTLEGSHIGIWDWDIRTGQWYASPTFYTMLGYEPHRGFSGHGELTERVHPEDLPLVARKMEKVLTGGFDEYTCEVRMRHADGSYRWQRVTGIGVDHDRDGKTTRMLGIRVDITDRREAEEALAQRERDFRTLAENSPDNVIRYDRDCRVLYTNHQARSTLGGHGEHALGRTPLEMSPEGLIPGYLHEVEAYQSALQGVIAKGGMGEVEMHVMAASGEMQTHSVRFTEERDAEGRIVGALAIGRDVTERKKLMEQLNQSQKMEAIGQLAGGVAHDFNNILTAIIGFGNLAKMRMKAEDPQMTLIDQILAASDRAANLTRSLLAFSRKQVIIPRPVDVNGILGTVEKLLARLIGEDIELVTRPGKQSLIVMADEGQIEQVLLNLATNARDAMPKGGTLSISTEARRLGKDFPALHGFGRQGRFALITVSDTGVGMDARTRMRIFEPFFTTKELGKGTGLGLSMVYGILQQHEGFINVYSEPGKGTTFRIYLPLADMAAADALPETEARPPGGTETLLLAEDDEVVRTMTSGILREFGYRVLEAADGKEALEKALAPGMGIDLMILDVVMPKMSGKEVYEAVRREGLEYRTLFISGYTADLLNRKGFFEDGAHYLSKPASPFDLLMKIRKILDERG